MNEIPFDEWTEVPNEKLSKKGKTQWVYRPSNYNGPLAIDGFIKKETIDFSRARIWLSKQEAKIMWPDT
jgi:hypothetical protein